MFYCFFFVIGCLGDAMKQCTRRSKTKNIGINRAKSRETITRSAPQPPISSSDDDDDVTLLNNLDKLLIPNAELTTHEQIISFQDDLQPFADTLSPDERKKKKTAKKSKNKKMKEREEKRKEHTQQLIKNGDLVGLIAFLDNYVQSNCESGNDAEIQMKIINEVLDGNNNTLLHLASLYEHVVLVKYLLDNEANPCCKNVKQQTPYTITQNGEIRDVFKKFAQDNPQKYNYNKAQIPLFVLSAEELAEKKKQQRKLKKVKEKLKKKENEIKMKEETEKQRFLQLSDREKVYYYYFFKFICVIVFFF